MNPTGIFVFRRDLRLDDNHGLIHLLKACKRVIPVFFLDQYQIVRGQHNKYYYSNNAVQFMCESLDDLDSQLRAHNSKLFCFFGEPGVMLKNMLKQLEGDVIVGWNTDFSKYSLARDAEMKKACAEYGAQVLETDTDLTLVHPTKLVKADGTAFKQYGAFYKNAVKTEPSASTKNKYSHYASTRTRFTHEFKGKLSQFYNENEHIAQHGGRIRVLLQLKHMKDFKDYNSMRDRLDYETTNISGALNFGCISVREAYEAIVKTLGKQSILVRQLYWRDFYLTAVRYLPHANNLKRHMDERYDKIKWKNSKSDWSKLVSSQTGLLLIDAGMNQMKVSGYLHNRARMQVVVMWTKYLLISPFHPKYGSQVGYSRLLLDAVGPSQNQMNHRWCTEFDFPGKKFSASGAPLSGRPMDISNKMIRKWDPECQYIKRWLPHLKGVPNKDLMKWDAEMASKYRNLHPAPMFDVREKYQEWVQACRKVK
jgi:deoxyribodipyrimidine photo-lyase